MSLNLNFLLIGLLHLNYFLDGSADVDVLAVFHEHVGLKLAVGKHIFDAKLQLITHVYEILVDLAYAIIKIKNILINTFIDSRLIKLLNKVVANSVDDARLVHD